jgi:hypothetical protein
MWNFYQVLLNIYHQQQVLQQEFGGYDYHVKQMFVQFFHVRLVHDEIHVRLSNH